MAHGADRISDFMRDARAQATKRGKLRLLDLFCDETRIFQEYEDRRGIHISERRKMRPDDARTVGSGEGLRCLRAGWPLRTPRYEKIQKARRGLAQERPGISAAIAQHLRG